MRKSLFLECNRVARSFSERHTVSRESKYVCSLKLRTTKTFKIQSTRTMLRHKLDSKFILAR